VEPRLLGNRDEARDSTQNACVKAFENLASFDQGQKFFSWIYQILRNECFHVLRGRPPADALEEGQRKAKMQAELCICTAKTGFTTTTRRRIPTRSPMRA